jgi:hypothetical protein
MWRLLDFRHISPPLSRLTAILPAISSNLRRLETHVLARSILVSDVFGADAYHANGSATPANNEKRAAAQVLAWDSALDFSAPQTSGIKARPVGIEVRAHVPAAGNEADADHPPFIEEDDPAQKALAVLAAVWQHARRGAVVVSQRLQYGIRSRGPALALAAVLVLLWIGAGKSTPLQPQRNPGADALADRFSKSGSSQSGPSIRAPVQDNAVASSELLNDGGLNSARFNFAPRLGGLLLDSGGMDDSGSQPWVPDANQDPNHEPSATAERDVETGAIPVPGDAGSVLIRNLPAGTVLSKGKQVSATEWAIARGDLDNVVVTLPANRRGSVKAVIEVLSTTGSQMGSMTVEIREQRVKTASAPRRGRVYRPAGEKAPLPASWKKQAALVNIVVPKAAPTQSPPPATQDAAPAISAPKSLFPQLPFFPSPAGTVLPKTNDSVGREIMINLGVVSRVPEPDLAKKN